MSEGFDLPETRRFIRTNKEKETKEHERQDFWSFAACGKILYASNRNSPCCRFAAWYMHSFWQLPYWPKQMPD